MEKEIEKTEENIETFAWDTTESMDFFKDTTKEVVEDKVEEKVEEEKVEEKEEKIKNAIKKVGTDKLRPIKDEAGDVTYAQIRLYLLVEKIESS